MSSGEGAWRRRTYAAGVLILVAFACTAGLRPLLLRRRGRDLAALASAPGMLVFAAIAAPWFVAMQLRFDGFLDYFIVEQHFRRYVASGFNNRQPFWFFPAVLLLLSAPWVPWVVRGLRQQTVVGARADPLRLLMLTRLVLVVLFLSLIHI